LLIDPVLPTWQRNLEALKKTRNPHLGGDWSSRFEKSKRHVFVSCRF
jgi:hypothetical protein